MTMAAIEYRIEVLPLYRRGVLVACAYRIGNLWTLVFG